MWKREKFSMTQLSAFRPGNGASGRAHPLTNLPKTQHGRHIFVKPAPILAHLIEVFLLKIISLDRVRGWHIFCRMGIRQ